MDDLKEKSVVLIILFFVIVLMVGIALKSKNINIEKNDFNEKTYISKSETSVVTTNNQNTTSHNNDSNNTSYYNPTNTKYYYSNDNKYYLILTENVRNYSNSTMGKMDRRYLMNIDEYYSTSSFTGTYDINDNKITLYVEAGCTNNVNNFDCVIPDKIDIIKKSNVNTMTLDYTEKQIQFGTVSLTKQN